MLLKEFLSNYVQKAVNIPNCACVYICVCTCVYIITHAVFFCKMQTYRQLGNARIVVGSNSYTYDENDNEKEN